MAPINTRVVRRSHALSSQWQRPYGDSFRYQEFWDLGASAGYAGAALAAFGMGFFQSVMRLPGVGRFVEAIAPAPGDGPSEETMDNGFYECRLVGTADDGTKAWARDRGKRRSRQSRNGQVRLRECACARDPTRSVCPAAAAARISDARHRVRRRSRDATAQRRCYARLPNDSVKLHVHFPGVPLSAQLPPHDSAVNDSRNYWTIGLLLAIGGVLCFSLRPILIKLAYAWSQDPITLLALRMAFAAPFFAGVAIWTRRSGAVNPISSRDMVYVVTLGLLSYYAASFLDFLALQYISAGLGRLVLFLYPTIVVLLSALFLSRPITARELIALVLTYAGLALVLLHSFDGNREVLFGAALAMASSLCYAVYLVAGSQVIARVGSMRFSAYAMIAATVACLLQFFLLRPVEALNAPVPVLGYAATMAVVSTVIPVFLTAEALRRVGANTVAIVGALGPVSTIALGWVGLEEAMTPLQLGGVGLVLIGVLAVSIRPRD